MSRNTYNVVESILGYDISVNTRKALSEAQKPDHNSDDYRTIKWLNSHIFDILSRLQNFKSDIHDVDKVYKSVEKLLDTARREIHTVDQ